MIDDRLQRPWRHDDAWDWANTGFEIQERITLEFDPNETTEHGSWTINVCAEDKRLSSTYAAICDSAVDYVLENPSLYGLVKMPPDENVERRVNVEVLGMRIRNCISAFERGGYPAGDTPKELPVSLLSRFAAAMATDPLPNFGGTSIRQLRAFFAANNIPLPHPTPPDAQEPLK